MTAEPIGRERESGLLDGFLGHDGGLRVALLIGEPGIGKSTLWERAVAAGRERSDLVLTSRPAETERGLAYLVLGDLFRDLDPSLLASLPVPRRRAFEAALLIGDTDGRDPSTAGRLAWRSPRSSSRLPSSERY